MKNIRISRVLYLIEKNKKKDTNLLSLVYTNQLTSKKHSHNKTTNDDYCYFCVSLLLVFVFPILVLRHHYVYKFLFVIMYLDVQLKHPVVDLLVLNDHYHQIKLNLFEDHQ